MSARGDHKRDYHEPRAGSRLHLMLLLLRSPYGLSQGRAQELGFTNRRQGMHSILNFLRVECGYEFLMIGEDKKTPFTRIRNGRFENVPSGSRAPFIYTVSCRYNWDTTVAEDFIANRLRREEERAKNAV